MQSPEPLHPSNSHPRRDFRTAYVHSPEECTYPRPSLPARYPEISFWSWTRAFVQTLCCTSGVYSAGAESRSEVKTETHRQKGQRSQSATCRTSQKSTRNFTKTKQNPCRTSQKSNQILCRSHQKLNQIHAEHLRNPMQIPSETKPNPCRF